MGIRHKTLLPLAVVMIASIIGFAIQTTFFWRQQKALEGQFDVSETATKLTQRILREDAERAVNVLSYRYTRDDTSTEQADASSRRVQESLKQLEALPLTEAHTAYLDTYKEAQQKRKESQEQLFAAIDSGVDEQINRSFMQWQLLNKRGQAALQDLAVYSANAPHASVGKLFMVQDLRDQVYFFSLILGLLSVVLLAYVFQRVLVRPIQSFAEKAREIGTGNFNVTFEYPYKDEIGDLAYAFNDMTSRLRNYTRDLEADVQRKTMEIQKSEGTLRAVLDALPVGVWISDAKGVLYLSNPAAYEIWGGGRLVGPEEYDIYQGWRVATGEPIGPDEWPLTRVLQFQEPVLGEEIRIQCFDGSTKDILDSTVPIRSEKGEFLGAVTINHDITAMKNHERALKESEEKWRWAFNYSPVGLALVAPDGRFLHVNASFCAMVGYDEEEMKQKTFADITHPDDVERDRVGVQELREGRRKMYETEKRYLRKDGGVVWVQLKSSVIRDKDGRILYFIADAMDITPRRIAEEELRKAKERIEEEARNAKKFQRAVESATDSIVITDAQANILFVNDAWLQMTGYAASEVQGKKPGILKTEKTPAAVNARMHDAIQNGLSFYSDELVNRRKDGSEYNVELTFFPVHKEESREVQFFVGFQSDITERKNVDRAKTDFVAVASHQLRTPLTEIRWALSRLGREDLTKEQGEIVQTAHGAALHMIETVRAMLIISRMEVGEIRPAKDHIPLCSVLDDVKQLHEGIRSQKEISLNVDCPDSIRTHTDQQLLKEILSNLLSNAYKYTPKNGSVAIRAEAKPDLLVIDVTDTGHGIPQGEQKRIGEKFFRASNIVDNGEEGNGIGLYLVYALAKLLGASVTFTSAENKGTTFSLSIPHHHDS